HCFNGAAIDRSRNYGAGRHESSGRARLQWGRDRSIAELAAILTYSDFKDLPAYLRVAHTANRPHAMPALSYLTQPTDFISPNSTRAVPGFLPPPHRSQRPQRVPKTGYSPISPSNTRASSRA